MDSETRPELAQNDLDRLMKGAWSKLSAYTGLLIAALVAIVVLAGGWAIMKSNAAAQRQAAWQKLTTAEVAERYAAVAEEFPDSEAAVWARLSEGKANLRDGMKLMYSDRETAKAKMEQARDAAEAVLNNSMAEDQALEQATMMLATITETLSDGNMQPAIDAYQRFIDEFPGSGQRGFAEAKIKELADPQVSEFYAWFSKQNPKPEAPATPDDGLGSAFPEPPPADLSEGDAGAADADATDADAAGDDAAEMTPESEEADDTAKPAETESSETAPSGEESTETDGAESVEETPAGESSN